MYTLIGTTDDTTTCDRCGKVNLKRTVVLKTAEGDIVYYGADCAARALRQAGAKQVTTAIVSGQADAVAFAQRLISKKLYTLDQIADAIWNRYGFSANTRDGALRIGTFAVVTPEQEALPA